MKAQGRVSLRDPSCHEDFFFKEQKEWMTEGMSGPVGMRLDIIARRGPWAFPFSKLFFQHFFSLAEKRSVLFLKECL